MSIPKLFRGEFSAKNLLRDECSAVWQEQLPNEGFVRPKESLIRISLSGGRAFTKNVALDEAKEGGIERRCKDQSAVFYYSIRRLRTNSMTAIIVLLY